MTSIAETSTTPAAPAAPRARRGGTPAHLSDFTELTARVKELGLMRRATFMQAHRIGEIE